MHNKPSQLERDAEHFRIEGQADAQSLASAKAGALRLEQAHNATGLTQRRGKLATVLVYGSLVRGTSGPGQISGADLTAAIEANADAQAIYFRISSEGGSTSALDDAGAALRRFHGRTIAVIDHFANSAAALFAIECDRVVIRRNASIMFHRMVAGLTGNCNQLRDFARSMSMMDATRLRAILRRVPARYRSDVTHAYENEIALSADEALTYRIADAIAPALLNSDDLVRLPQPGENHVI